MKRVVLFIFLALGIISFSADYSKGKAAELKLIQLSGNQYGFEITYFPEKDGVGEDEPLKVRESKTEIGVATKNGNIYYYEGESYAYFDSSFCTIEITESAKQMNVKTNKGCAGRDDFDGTYKYKKETSAADVKDLKHAIDVFNQY